MPVRQARSQPAALPEAALLDAASALAAPRASAEARQIRRVLEKRFIGSAPLGRIGGEGRLWRRYGPWVVHEIGHVGEDHLDPVDLAVAYLEGLDQADGVGPLHQRLHLPAVGQLVG